LRQVDRAARDGARGGLGTSALRNRPARLATQARTHNYLAWALLYAAFVAYGSLVVGPAGLHFVPLDPAEAWKTFRATPFFDNGSDQRPDWVANLLLTMPLGFLAGGVAASARGKASRLRMAALALILCLAFVFAVKYAQLFFPPRTVSLNYIVAQSLGVCIGMAAFPLIRARASALARLDDRARLKLLLDFAVLAFVAFALFPFDIVLSASDLSARLGELSHSMMAPPWPERPAGVRAVLAASAVASAMPLGMRLALRRDTATLPRVAAVGTAWMILLLAASALMLSTSASLATMALRVGGIVAGAGVLQWLSSQDIERARLALARLVPLTAVAYLLLLAYVQDLLQPHWRTPAEALAELDPRGMLPLWHYYIVTKAHAAQDFAAHAAMYAPIGVMAWLRVGHGQGGGWKVGFLAAVLALLVETARGLLPGRATDPDAVIVAGLAAALAFRACPAVWRLLGSVTATPAIQSPRLSPAAPVTALARAQRAAFVQIAAQRVEAVAVPPLPITIRVVIATGCAIAVAALAARYPLGTFSAAMVLVAWVALLWWRPSLWLILLPAALPSIDLAPWTGWLVTSEADMLVLATIGVLLLRDPPSHLDLWPKGPAGFALMLATLAWVVGLARGLLLPDAVPGGSDNPYLEPLDAIREAKPFIEALALLPFLLARQRAHRDAIPRFGYGMLSGLILVGIAAVLERAAFVGIFDLSSDYRVVATFSSMHIGGGHIGAFIALALPFLFVCLDRPSARTMFLLGVIVTLGGYTLVVTFARTAYASALTAVVVTAAAWAIAQRAQGRRAAGALATVLPALVIAVVAIGLFTPYMATRLTETAEDFATRERNWKEGLALDRQDWLSFLIGTGIGTYPRIVAASPLAGETPGNYVLGRDDGRSYLTLHPAPGFYFGQKVPVVGGTSYTLTLKARTAGDATLQVGLCAKLLLYSFDCHAATLRPGARWTQLTATIVAPRSPGLVPAPVELWLAGDDASPLDIAELRLVGGDGGNVLANGDFADGTARWLFTSDYHLDWRIKNLYLATWFDGGVLGLLASMVVVATSMAEACRAVRRGDRWGAPIIGALVALLVSGVFDDVLEAPRLACLYVLVILLGLTLGGPRIRAPKAG
jgi:VanZ family protein